VDRKLFSPDQFLKELKKKCAEKGLDAKRANSRTLLYLVEIGLIYPVRIKRQKYESKKYSRVDLKVMELLLEQLAGSTEKNGASKRPIKVAVEKLAEKIEKENLLEKVRQTDQPPEEQLVLREAYKRFLTRTSALGYKNPEKTDILEMRRGDHSLLIIEHYNQPTKEMLFHEILERIVRSADNELVLLVTRAKGWDVARSLQKRLREQKEKTRMLITFKYKDIARIMKKLLQRAVKTAHAKPDQIKNVYKAHFWDKLIRYIRQEAISRAIDLEAIEHIWFINEVSYMFYATWPEQLNYFRVENDIKNELEKNLNKNVTMICVYEKNKLFSTILSREKNLLQEVGTLIGIHNRIYAFDKVVHDRTQAVQRIMYWMDEALQKKYTPAAVPEADAS